MFLGRYPLGSFLNGSFSFAFLSSKPFQRFDVKPDKVQEHYHPHQQYDDYYVHFCFLFNELLIIFKYISVPVIQGLHLISVFLPPFIENGINYLAESHFVHTRCNRKSVMVVKTDICRFPLNVLIAASQLTKCRALCTLLGSPL